jgi:hypothetical protein
MEILITSADMIKAKEYATTEYGDHSFSRLSTYLAACQEKNKEIKKIAIDFLKFYQNFKESSRFTPEQLFEYYKAATAYLGQGV